MRHRVLHAALAGLWLTATPVCAHADEFADALAAYNRGDLKTALPAMRSAVRADPLNAEAHYWLAMIAYRLGDMATAEFEAEGALQRGFDAHRTALLMAQTLLGARKYDQLLDSVKPEGLDKKFDSTVLTARGEALAALHRPDDAQRAFADAEQLDPTTAEPLLADARLAVSRGDPARARTLIDRAISAQPRSLEAVMALSQLLRRGNDVAGAIAALDRLLADQPGLTPALIERASLELTAGKREAAQSDLDTILAAEPANVAAAYLRGVMLVQVKDFKAADAALTPVADQLARVPRGLYLFAVVKEQQGQLEEAEAAARKFLARAGDDLEGQKLLARIQMAKRRPDLVIETLGGLADSGKIDAESADLLGRADSATGRTAEAVRNFQKAAALAPNDAGVKTRLAAAHMASGDADAAIADLEQALALAPSQVNIAESLFIAALATGDMAKAEAVLARIRDVLGPSDPEQNLEGAWKLASTDLDGAEAIFSALLAHSPDFVPARINLARVLTMRGKRDAAEAILTSMLDAHPAAEPALSMLSTLYAQSGRLPLAISLLQRAHAAEPANTRITTRLGDMEIRANGAQTALDLANTPTGAPAPELMALRANALLALGRKQDSAAALAELLALDPNQIGARRQLAALQIGAGDLDAARKTLAAGIAAAPRTFQLYLDLALIDLKTNSLDAALATADRLQAQDPDFVQLRTLKAEIYLAANRPQDAVAVLGEVQAKAPSSVLAIRLAVAQRQAGHPDDAVAQLSAWVAEHADDLAAKSQLAELLLSLNRFDPAIALLEAIVHARPRDATTLNNLAWAYQQKGDPRAFALARQAYILSPIPSTADTLGWILTGQGQAEAGLAYLRQAAADAPGDPRVQYHFAVALNTTGNKAEAIARLAGVVAAEGDFTEKAQAKQLLETLKGGG